METEKLLPDPGKHSTKKVDN